MMGGRRKEAAVTFKGEEPGILGVRAADLEASEDRGEEGSARGKRIEPLLRVIPGSGEEASRREGLR